MLFFLVPIQALKIICQDMFFSRSRTTPTSQRILGVPVNSSNRAALETAFKIARTQDEKTNVTGELLEMKVTLPTEAEFSEQALSNRMSGYEKFTNQAQVRHLLASKGGFNAQSDFVAARLAELKGLPKPPEEGVKR